MSVEISPEALVKYKVESAPNSLYYIPNFITEEEEAHILKNVYGVPKPKWTQLKNRRLQDYGGIPHMHGLVTEPIPSWLKTYMKKVSDLKVFRHQDANHVLINEYRPGQGIMPHLDGALFTPTITTISCGSHTVLEFVKGMDARTPVCNVFLEQRSLVILRNDLYKKFMHFIDERECDILNKDCVNLSQCGGSYSIGTELKRDTRISLTIRNVPKVAKVNLLNILMKGK